MKKIKIMSMLFILIIMLSSCSSINKDALKDEIIVDEEEQSSDNPIAEGSVSDYFPFENDIRLVYSGTGNDYADTNIYVDFIKEDRMQLRVIYSGNSSCVTYGQLVQVRGGEISFIKNVDNFYYRDNLTEDDSNVFQIILKEPLQVGNSWILSDGRKAFISSIDKEIVTSLGSFNAIEVTTENGDDCSYDYFVKDIGLVKMQYIYNGEKVTNELQKIVKDAFVEQTIKFYYPEYEKNRIVYKKNKISLKTNEEIKYVFEEYFKNPPTNDSSSLISLNTKINSLYLDKDKLMVMVDFSSDFIKDMNLGSGYEAERLQAIGNTLGDYYNVDKVDITVDGKSYESGHIIVDENNPITTNLEKTIEVK
ncbi:MAG: GerMN domain-containing protein [Clostridiaceae bacterium]